MNSLINADSRALHEYFVDRLVNHGARATYEWLTDVLDTQSPEARASSCVLVAYTGCAEAIDWLETRVGSPVTESWGGAAALLGVSWTRIVSWLNRGAATQLMALDALVAYRNPAPNMSPLAQIAAPALPDPPSRSILEDTLAEVLESRNTPRVRKTIERIQHYAHEMLARRTRRVPVEDLPRLYLDPDSFPSAQPILETHEATTSRMRRLLQSVLNRDKLR